ncbi:MAG: hypothetical protein HOM84_04850 [Thiotrichales bacterium]|nr:hypothetical protein [Thiotrichales bacterium]MBT3614024.1 hypothetical protein [Thiotrichales bacterium]MBT3751835.1 hypothetical protein [Thiotrichales bacterium]MBT3838034.1 hypothetical protein [Thiotrichales bacterium]MBT4152053.1 hypothetical protein [Thiotrichales bacterium]
MIKVRRLLRRFDTLSLQEHSIWSGAIFIAILLLWFVIVSVKMENIEVLESEIAVVDEKVVADKIELVELEKSYKHIEPELFLQKEADLVSSIEQLNSDIKRAQGAGKGSYRPVEETLNLLLRNLQGVRVVNLSKLAEGDLLPMELEWVAEFSRRGVSVTGIFLELRGGFQQTFDFLHSVEAMEENIRWSELRYDVEEYPNAVIKLRFFILSGVINVIE